MLVTVQLPVCIDFNTIFPNTMELVVVLTTWLFWTEKEQNDRARENDQPHWTKWASSPEVNEVNSLVSGAVNKPL